VPGNLGNLRANPKGKLIMKKQTITFAAILMALGCFAVSPQIHAVSPPPDGCYPGFTTAEGCNALALLGAGAGNTGIGWYSLFSAGASNFNTGVGAGTLVLNAGDSNTAVGAAALLLNTSGFENTAVGTDALVYNDSGQRNSAFGAFSLFNNIDGSFNTALGRCALLGNLHGTNNTAIGYLTLVSNDTSGNGTGVYNTAVGDSALMNNIDGASSTAVGFEALLNSTGDYNTALGANAGTDPGIVSNNVYIGDPGFPGDTNVISIGGIAASGTPYELTFIGGIYGSEVNVGTALPVYVDTDGHLGTSLVNASGQKVRVRSPQGARPQAMLNEFQKQQTRIAELENTVARLAATVKDQAALIQKVSAQVEMTKPAPTVVTNNQ
jgi:hypothetical protein